MRFSWKDQNVMYTYESIAKISRPIRLTHCRAGYNDLCPESDERRAGYGEIYEDFFSQSFHPYPARETNCPAWAAAYRAKDDEGQEREFADLMVLDLHGCSVAEAHRLLVENNLAGLAHPTRSDTLACPRSRIIFLLHRPVNDLTYRLLWRRLAQEVFSSFTNPAHADFRQRYDQPHAIRNRSTLMRHDGNLLNVEGLLAEPTLAGVALGIACQAYVRETWPESMAPRNR